MPTAYIGSTTPIIPFPVPVVVAACFFISAAARRPGWGPGCKTHRHQCRTYPFHVSIRHSQSEYKNIDHALSYTSL